jgi:hypothetical protein
MELGACPGLKKGINLRLCEEERRRLIGATSV